MPSRCKRGQPILHGSFFLIITQLLKRGKTFPLLVTQSLQFNAGLIHWCPVGIEAEIIADLDLEVVEEPSSNSNSCVSPKAVLSKADVSMIV